MELLLNIFLNRNLKQDIKRLRVLLYIYLGTFLIQIFSHQEGEVLLKIWNIYITKAGVINFTASFESVKFDNAVLAYEQKMVNF